MLSQGQKRHRLMLKGRAWREKNREAYTSYQKEYRKAHKRKLSKEEIEARRSRLVEKIEQAKEWLKDLEGRLSLLEGKDVV